MNFDALRIWFIICPFFFELEASTIKSMSDFWSIRILFAFWELWLKVLLLIRLNCWYFDEGAKYLIYILLCLSCIEYGNFGRISRRGQSRIIFASLNFFLILSYYKIEWWRSWSINLFHYFIWITYSFRKIEWAFYLTNFSNYFHNWHLIKDFLFYLTILIIWISLFINSLDPCKMIWLCNHY